MECMDEWDAMRGKETKQTGSSMMKHQPLALRCTLSDPDPNGGAYVDDECIFFLEARALGLHLGAANHRVLVRDSKTLGRGLLCCFGRRVLNGSLDLTLAAEELPEGSVNLGLLRLA